MDGTQPGQVIMPNLPEEPEPKGGGVPGPDRPTEQPGAEPTPAPITPSPVPSNEQPQMQPDAGWDFHMESPHTVPQTAILPDTLTWTASEFIDHEKGAGWYGLLVLAGLALAGVVYLLTRDVISTAGVIFAIFVFGVFAARKPRVQKYALTPYGLQIGSKVYSFQDYKNFSIAPEGAAVGIMFMPLKRFMVPLTVYVMPDMEDQVLTFLAGILPFERHQADAFDGLLRRIHF